MRWATRWSRWPAASCSRTWGCGAGRSDDRAVAADGGHRRRDERSVAVGGFSIRKALWWCAGPIRSEEHTSELQSLMRISYAVFCLKKKKTKNRIKHYTT